MPEMFFSSPAGWRGSPRCPPEAQAYLIAVALRIQDAGLLALVRGWLPKAKPEKRAAVEKAAQALGEAFLQSCRRPILDLVAEKTSYTLAQGAAMRRAVVKTGRLETGLNIHTS